MQIRRLWHCTLGIVCAIFLNGLLILLLILASPRKIPEPLKKTTSYLSWLKLSQAENSEAHVNDLLNTQKTICLKSTVASEQKKLTLEPQNTSLSSIPDSLELSVFFQKGQEMLHELNTQKLTSDKSTRSTKSLDRFNLDPLQFYYLKAINHINAYRNTLRKKYAKLRIERQERLERQPELFIVINKDGSLLNIFLEKSSGSPTYDKFCMQAIKQAAPLPKIPRHLKLEHLTLPL